MSAASRSGKPSSFEPAIPPRANGGLYSASRAVLGVVYLLFNEGYVATAGADLHRPVLAEEALRLAALLVELMPDDPEARGLNALVLLQHSRSSTRVSSDGVLVPLEEQDRTKWDRRLIAAGPADLQRGVRRERLGPYQLQAMIAASHVTSASVEETDWARIVELYDALLAQVPSPTVALNRAVAVAMRSGADAGLDLLDELERDTGWSAAICCLPRGPTCCAGRGGLIRLPRHTA
jgi:RNA polymerase sigma-70 factor (ECF subfamily)